jgi:hypothetical protein
MLCMASSVQSYLSDTSPHISIMLTLVMLYMTSPVQSYLSDTSWCYNTFAPATVHSLETPRETSLLCPCEHPYTFPEYGELGRKCSVLVPSPTRTWLKSRTIMNTLPFYFASVVSYSVCSRHVPTQVLSCSTSWPHSHGAGVYLAVFTVHQWGRTHDTTRLRPTLH